MLKARKYRIYPNAEQRKSLACNFGCARFVYNKSLSIKSECYKSDAYSVSRFEFGSLLVIWKDQQQNEWLKQAHSQVLQSALLHLDTAFKNFFAGRGKYPKFKNKYGKQSIQYPQGVKFKDGKIWIPKVGLVKIKIHREAIGKIKTVTVSLDNTGCYYASVLLDNGIKSPPPKRHVTKHVGLDMGITDFITMSNGEKVDNQRFTKRASKNLKRKQQALSRKQKGSKRRAKARLLVAKAHKKTANARNDFHHKISHELASKNQAVSIEDLNISGMSKNRKLAKHIVDLGWHSFTTKLAYKLEDKGGHLIKIDRFYPSSKTCSDCGSKVDTLPLNIRHWTCDNCGSYHDRDINAAINIQRQGILKLKTDGIAVSASGGSRKSDISSVAACEAGSHDHSDCA